MALRSAIVNTTNKFISFSQRRSLPSLRSSLSSHSEGFDALVSSKKFYSSNPAHFSSSSSSSVQTSQSVDEIFQKILQLDTIEVHLLTELVNEKLGVAPLTPAQRAAMAQGGGGSSQAAVEEKEEEKTAFDLQLTGFDAKSKIKVIKEIRTITGLGLKDAKEMVEGAPKVVKKDIKMEEAEELKAKLEAVGGTVEIS